MANKLAHLVVENNTYDIQDEELTNKFDGMTIELALSNDYIITATLKDGNNTTLSTATIDLPSENSLVSLDYDNTTNEIIGIYRDDTVAVPHRIRVELDNLQEKLTAGQNISIINNTVSLLGIGEASTETVTGIATLDSYGKVPSSQLPSYVDDVLEYSTLQDFPVTGEAGKIYVTLDTNKTYRWTGSVYVEISKGVVLGETEYTAYRGDRGKIAYDHAIAKGSAYANGLYKITTNSEGHVTSATTVQKTDITALGIPAQDTQPNNGKLTLLVNNDQSTKVEFTANDNTNKTFNVTQPIYNKAIEIVNNQVSVRYADKQWDISRDSNNKLFINGKFIKQVDDLDTYTDAIDGEIVEFIGTTDTNYTNGYFYKRHAGSVQYETITIPANTTAITFHFPDGTEETGYVIEETLSIDSASWFDSHLTQIEALDGGTFTNTSDWYERFNYDIAKVGDEIWVKDSNNNYIWGGIECWHYTTNQPNLNVFPDSVAEATSREEATTQITNWLTDHGYTIPQIFVIYDDKVKVTMDNNGTTEHYYITPNGGGGYSSRQAKTLLSPDGKKVFVRGDDVTSLTMNRATEVRQKNNNNYWYCDPDYNYPTTATSTTTTEAITLTVPVLYDSNGKRIDTGQTPTPASWERIDVQPNVTKTSDLLNDSDFITHLVSNLTNYYTKSETDAAIGKGAILFQKNGTDITLTGSPTIVDNKTVFGANQSGTTICNIPVPIQTSELTNNGEGVTGYPFITKAVNNLENYYTEAEVDNLLSQLETNIDWKEAVNTYADIATTYPNPQDGWTVNVKDTDYTYRYNGTEWVAISANAIPLATQSINGLMSATDKTKLDGIEAGAEVNVQSDWNQSNMQADDYIKNKPTIPQITFRQWRTE